MPNLLTTTNNDLSYPSSANSGQDFSTGIADLANSVDAMWDSGTLAGRPAAGIVNRRYYATDTGVWYLDTGAAWVPVPQLGTGTDSLKPSAVDLPGMYFATDSEALYGSDGTNWHTIYGSRGAVNISASQTVTSTTYTTLTTPDQVTGVVMPTNGLIAVWYQAAWQESVVAAARMSLFLGSNQVVAAYEGIATHTVEAGNPSAASGPNVNSSISTWSLGLAAAEAGSGYTGDVTTGQAIGQATPVTQPSPGITSYINGLVTDLAPCGGPCYIFAAAGTYTVGVRFKASSGSVTASNRKLWVQAIPSA